jgi:pilus assembly protein CpaE
MQREMDAKVMDKLEHRGVGDRLVFCSSNREHVSWITNALGDWQVLQKALTSIDELAAHMADALPRLVLLDFSEDCGSDVADCAKTMYQLAQLLTKSVPNVPLIAVGNMNYPEGAVAALRGGIHHFIDMAADPEEARQVVRKLLAAKPASPNVAQGQLITLLGARAGIGTTTLAVHLADMLQRQKTASNQPRRIGLLDLGIPIGDGQLYLNVSGNFNFADTVRNRHRMDQTLIHTALAGTAKGLKVVPLPRALQDLNDLSDADVVALLVQLRRYFDVLIIDLGGFPEQAFTQNIANASDQTWFVTDQSAGSLISLATMLSTLEDHADNSSRQLIVNRYDKQFGMSAQQISDRFGLPLAAVLPERTLKLTSCINQGKLLHDVNHGDAYVRVVEELAGKALNVHQKPLTKQGLLAKLTSRFTKHA